MEAYVWASTDPDLGVCVSTRVFGSVDDAKADAQECIGDACPVEWDAQQSCTVEEARGVWTNPDGFDGTVVVQLLKVQL